MSGHSSSSTASSKTRERPNEERSQSVAAHRGSRRGPGRGLESAGALRWREWPPGVPPRGGCSSGSRRATPGPRARPAASICRDAAPARRACRVGPVGRGGCDRSPGARHPRCLVLVPKALNSGPEGSLPVAVLVDTLLLLLFAVPHSVIGPAGVHGAVDAVRPAPDRAERLCAGEQPRHWILLLAILPVRGEDLHALARNGELEGKGGGNFHPGASHRGVPPGRVLKPLSNHRSVYRYRRLSLTQPECPAILL